ncbi:MAG: response regulator [Blastocatellia bacterium]|nr:response regulator [Blastocatellia bacterium]
MSRILIVDDETNLRRILSVLLQADGHAVTEAVGRADAVALLASAPFDLVITDQRMPDGEGLDVLAAAREADPALPVVMLTAYATVELAVDAMRLGAFDVIAKPFVPDVVRAVVHRAVERTDLLRENERLKDVVRRLEADDGLLGTSGVMQVLRTESRRLRRPARRSLSQVKPGRARSSWRARCTREAPERTSPSSPLTVPPFPNRCWRASFLDTSAVRSPAPTGHAADSSKRRIAAHCSSTRPVKCRSACRPSSCACSTTVN